MTDHYLDIQVLGDTETSPNHVLSVLMGKLHHALVKRGQQDIGISFPMALEADEHCYRMTGLGNLLRLHGTDLALNALMELRWLTGLQDHMRLGEIMVSPSHAKYRVVSRVQAKSNPQRLRRRLQRRHGLSEQEARERIPDAVAERLDLPFVSMTSTSSGQRFRLFIHQGPLMLKPQVGVFNTYGTSVQATVPWF